jgi:PST family polysaccharide transporter
MNVVSNALWNGARSAVGLAIGFATSILIARTLGAASFGELAYVVWAVTTLTAVVGLGFPMTLMKFAADADVAGGRPAVAGLLDASLARAAGAAAVAGGVLVGAAAVLPLGMTPAHALLAALTVVPGALAACYGGAINGLQDYRPTTRASIAVSLGQLALSVLVLARGGRVTALLAVNLACAAVTLVWLRRDARAMVGRAAPGRAGCPRPVARYAATMLVLTLLDAIVWKRAEVVFLARWWGPVAVARFSLAAGIAEKAMRIPHALYGTLFPAFSHLAARGDHDAVEALLRRGLRLISLVIVPVGLLVAAVAEPLVAVLYGAGYSGVAGPLAAMMLVNVVGATTGVLVMALYGTGQQRVLMIRDGTGAVVNLALNLTLTARWGVWGAVAAHTTAQLVSAAIVWWHVGRRFALPPLLAPLPRVLAAGLATAALAWLVIDLVHGVAGLAAGLAMGGVAYAGALVALGAVALPPWRRREVRAT